MKELISDEGRVIDSEGEIEKECEGEETEKERRQMGRRRRSGMKWKRSVTIKRKLGGG